MTTPAIDRHIGAAMATWQERSRRVWTLDLGILTGAGIRLAPAPAASARETMAVDQTRQTRQREDV